MQRQQASGRSRALIFLIGSIVMALIAVAIVLKVLRDANEQAREAERRQSETVQVVIATRDLYMGLPIGPDDVAEREVAPEVVSRDNIFSALPEVLGRTPRERILAGEPVRSERLARPDAGVGLNAIVPPGKRAMTIATTVETGVAGLLQAGNYIDIIVTIRPEDPSSVGAKWVSETILQGIRVLAVGTSLDRESQAAKDSSQKKSGRNSSADQARKLKPSITLEVTPEEAEKLALAISRGDVHVALRSDIDILQYDSHGLTTGASLIGYPPRSPSSAPAPRQAPAAETPEVLQPALPTAEVIQGSKTQEVTFGSSGGTSTDKKK